MASFKTLVMFVLLSLICGCASVMVNYVEKEPNKFIVKEFKVTQNPKKTWNALKNSSFPIYKAYCKAQEREIRENNDQGHGATFILMVVPIDLAILPFQALYDLFFSPFEYEYDKHIKVSGQIVNSSGAINLDIKHNGGLLDSLKTNDKGFFVETYDFNERSANQYVNEINIEISEIKDQEKEMFGGGKEVVITGPLAINNIIDIKNKAVKIKQESIFPVVSKTGNGLRDEIKFDTKEQVGDIVVLEEIRLFSEKNLKIQYEENIVYEKEINRQNIIRREEAKIEQRKNKIRYWIGDEDLMLTSSNEKEIFSVFSDYDMRSSILSIMNSEKNKTVYIKVTILQNVDNRNMLFSIGNIVFYGTLADSCVKREYYDGQIVEMAGLTQGVYRYENGSGVWTTVPKVKLFAIRPITH